ncbi:alpha-amylase family glycosyl hydrolase [Populibacterium corticicola]|uniref:Alpha-amylase family glycosyl hydrolase n=2 Tax=Populibacterium corticicola TaxID=1812826 RepID=A0ABW5XGZ3_9MICO
MMTTSALPAPPEWLKDAVIYEIYPQSFLDTNGDGIGDLDGVIEKLDYLKWLGINTIWFNPCFDSPFRDAGYDVADYLRIAPRYGTNETMETLVQEARRRGIRVLLDLVAGHTSIEHQWFRDSCADQSNHRYVWAPADGDTAATVSGDAYVPSPGPRTGWYLKNFFAEQPALNFGYARLDPSEPWRQLPTDEWPRRNREALKEIIGFWLDRGVAGFRVDMAFSLVKDDPGLVENSALWREISRWMHENYPDAVLLPESDEHRTLAAGQSGGFDGDFALVIQQEHSALFNNGSVGKLPWQEDDDPCYFDAHVSLADGSAALKRFLGYWQDRWDACGEDRLIVLPSSDHDFSRVVTGERGIEQSFAAFTFLLTWGSVPSIYFGDEIGMRNLPDAPEKEGSRWNPKFDRSGCRTPMQWDGGLPNAGFSSARPEYLYLPQDPSKDRPTVAAQLNDPDSLLNHVRALLALREDHPELGAGTAARVLNSSYPFVFQRGESYVVAINPRAETMTARVECPAGDPELLRGSNATIGDEQASSSIASGSGDDAAVTGPTESSHLIEVGPFGYGIFRFNR